MFRSGAQVFLISSVKLPSGRLSMTSRLSSWRNETDSPFARQRVSVMSSPCNFSGPAATAPFLSICILLMTIVLAGSSSKVRSTFLIQNGGAA